MEFYSRLQKPFQPGPLYAEDLEAMREAIVHILGDDYLRVPLTSRLRKSGTPGNWMLYAPSQDSAGGSSPSPWKVSVSIDENDDLVASIETGWKMFKSPFTPTELEFDNYDVDEENPGWVSDPIATLTLDEDDYGVVLELTLDSLLNIEDEDPDKPAFKIAKIDGYEDFYDLKGVSPDYIEKLRLPIARIIENEPVQLLYTTPSLVPAIINRYAAYWFG